MEGLYKSLGFLLVRESGITKKHLHHRHVLYVVKAPPISGPVTIPSWLTAASTLAPGLIHPGQHSLPMVSPIKPIGACQQLELQNIRRDLAKVINYLPARFSKGAQLEMMMRAPLIIPAAPKPATARPTINMTEETAAPQSTEPSSKIAKKTRKVHCFSVVSKNESSFRS